MIKVLVVILLFCFVCINVSEVQAKNLGNVSSIFNSSDFGVSNDLVAADTDDDDSDWGDDDDEEDVELNTLFNSKEKKDKKDKKKKSKKKKTKKK